jgi:hypothetical protein
MQNPTREQVAVALFNLVSGVPGIQYASRRPAMWSNSVAMPALYMGNSIEEYVYKADTATPPVVVISFDFFLYIDAGQDPNTTPDTKMNALLDAIEAAIGNVPGIPQTLGALVHSCWIEGQVHRAPGYINGQGLALITVKILVPQ